MIELKCPDHSRIYQLLTKKPSLRDYSLPGDNWQEPSEDSTTTRLLVNGPVGLLWPLISLNQVYQRNDNYYLSYVTFLGTEDINFENYTGFFSEKLEKKGLFFYSTSSGLTGHILKEIKEGSEPIASVIASEDRLDRAIGIGTFGSRRRKLGDVSDFEIELGLLNEYANLFLKSVYENSIYSQVGGRKPKISLSFQPV